MLSNHEYICSDLTSFAAQNIEPERLKLWHDGVLGGSANLARVGAMGHKRPKSILNNVRRGIRQWSQRYPTGLRGLRLPPNNNPIAFAAIFPIHEDSEIIFDMPPSQSLYLSRFHLDAKDSIQFAPPGDDQCHIAYIRSWEIHPDFWNYENALLLTQDTQATLRELCQDYPELSQVYSIAIHPRLAAFAKSLGFEIMRPDPNTSLYWLYISLDNFLALDADDLLADFDYTLYTSH